jgi:hypothetical protein
MRTQMQFDTYAAPAGGLGMAGADVPAGEGPAGERAKRERSEDDEDVERRGNDDGKRYREEREDEE